MGLIPLVPDAEEVPINHVPVLIPANVVGAHFNSKAKQESQDAHDRGQVVREVVHSTIMGQIPNAVQSALRDSGMEETTRKAIGLDE